jgi:tripartite-type tricarboxylate transporter receptor subunit TctC
MSRVIGQQVIVENKSGAGGLIGIETAAKSSPDGYTVLSTTDALASLPAITSLNTDFIKDLVPVIHLTSNPVILAVHTSLGVTSVDELIRAAKLQPGMSYATSGIGSQQHFAGEWFARIAGIKLDNVPYRRRRPGDQRFDRRACFTCSAGAANAHPSL